MATEEETQSLLRVAPQGTMTLAEIGSLLDFKGFNLAAAELWDVEAMRTASLVDVSESGSSRKMSTVHANAKAMAEMYRNRAESETDTGGVGTAYSRLMTR